MGHSSGLAPLNYAVYDGNGVNDGIAGTVIGVNCGTVENLKKIDYPRQAYELGKAF